MHIPQRNGGIAPRFGYHPAMVDGAKMGATAIVLLVLFVVLLVASVTAVCCCCCVCRGRRKAGSSTAATRLGKWKWKWERTGWRGVSSREREGGGGDEEERQREEGYVFEMFKRGGWERERRRESFWKGREREMEARAKRVKEEWRQSSEVGVDGFARVGVVGGSEGGAGEVRVPSQARVKEWRMWNMP